MPWLSSFSLPEWEGINTAALWIMGISGFITAVAVIVNVIASSRIDAIKDRRLREVKDEQALAADRLSKADEKSKVLEQHVIALQERYQGRTLSHAQKDAMIGILSREKAGSIRMIGAVAGDGEALAFAREIQEVFRNAHWIVEKFEPNEKSSDNQIGIVLRVQSHINCICQDFI